MISNIGPSFCLESFFSSGRLAGSSYSAVHTADALRLLMLYKYGGFYLDLDYVVFNDLTQYNNIVVGNKPYVFNMKMFKYSSFSTVKL